MKKKIVLALFMAAVMTGTAFAQPSFGFGVTFPFYSTDVTLVSSEKERLDRNGFNSDWNFKASGAVFFTYLDLHYVTTALGFGFYRITPGVWDHYAGSSGNEVYIQRDKERLKNRDKETLTTFEIELLGKYPFDIGREITIFPLLGINFRMAIANDVTDDGTTLTYDERYVINGWYYYPATHEKVSKLNTVWFKFGFGMDIPLNSAYTVYLRPMLLYGFGTQDKPQEYSSYLDHDKTVNHGLDIKVAIGFIF